MWVSGVPAICLACGQPSRLTVLHEHWIVQDNVFVGTLACSVCQGRSAYSRRPTAEERESMSVRKGKAAPPGRKRGTGKAKSRKPRRSSLQGAIARALGPEKTRAVPAVDPITLPSADRAVEVLRELAELNDKAVALHVDFEHRRDDAKLAKEAWELAVKAVQERLQQATHPAPMPLFDQAEREADQAHMEAAAADQPLDLEPGDGDTSVAF
jgi:hypothetical protein